MSLIYDAAGCETPVCANGTPSSRDTVPIGVRWMQSLHDGPAQWLALALLQLDQMLNTAGTSDVPALRNVRLMVSEALRGTRQVLEERADSPAEAPMPLVASLVDLGQRLSSLTGQTLCLDCSTVIPDPPQPVAATVLQAARELLVNTCKHAPGARVELALVAVASGFELTIRDNGPGFDPLVVNRRHGAASGLGLGAIPERLNRVGATLNLQSHPGAGVRACIRWPGRVVEPVHGDTQMPQRLSSP
jgi:signal transduction histidine kinase